MAEEKKMGVKDVVLDMVKDQKCGNTLDNGAAQPIPSDGKVKWLGNGGGGFTHVGPCEIYLDDKMVLHGDNCEDEFKGGDVGSTQTSDILVVQRRLHLDHLLAGVPERAVAGIR